MAIKSKINYNNSNVLGTNIFSKEEISAPIDNIPVQSVISYLETTNITPRDYYKGTSFRYSGEWLTGTHYLNDQYFVDFAVINNVLLRCKKSHLSSLESKPVRFIYDDKGNIVGIDSEYWDFVLAGFNVGEGSNFQRYYEGNTSEVVNPGEGDVCIVPGSNTSYIYYKGEWHPWLYISLDNITNWNNKADKVQSATAGHIATLDSSGNLVDSGKGISDINPLWGNIQGSIENQADLMEALNAKYTKPSTGIPKTDLASAVQTSLEKADTAVQPTDILIIDCGTAADILQSI